MIEYHFRVPSAAVFTLYSYSKALEYLLEYPTAASLNEYDGDFLNSDLFAQGRPACNGILD
jgi:hypothetical protein